MQEHMWASVRLRQERPSDKGIIPGHRAFSKSVFMASRQVRRLSFPSLTEMVAVLKMKKPLTAD